MESTNNFDRVAECIEACPKGICDGCILKATGVHPHQQVNSISLKLASRGITARNKGICARCNRTLCVSVAKSTGALPRGSKSKREHGEVEAVAQPDLDALRRFIIQRLNLIDKENSRQEGFSRRINRLRDAGVIPWNIASLTLTFASYRNRTYYDGFTPGPAEAEILTSIGDFLDGYFKTFDPN